MSERVFEQNKRLVCGRPFFIEGCFYCSVRETHAIAEAQQEKNARLRDAFGISPRFVEGTSLDPERRAREQAQKYPLVRTPSHEREERDAHVSKKKKKRRYAVYCIVIVSAVALCTNTSINHIMHQASK